MGERLVRILIVDDEMDICFLLKSILKQETNGPIDFCSSVKKGIEQLNTTVYDLAFFDMHLYDGTAIDLIEFVNKMEGSSPFIVVMSAYCSDSEKQKLKNLAIDEFLSKPLSKEKISSSFLAACG